MSRAQRFTFLGIAFVIAIVAVIVLADSSEDDATPPATEADATATATPATDATATATEGADQSQPAPPLLTGGKVTRLEHTEGDMVRFRVTSDVPEEVHVHGYDIAKDLEPGKTTSVSFKATITGIFEIEYEHAGEQIGELRVEPR